VSLRILALERCLDLALLCCARISVATRSDISGMLSSYSWGTAADSSTRRSTPDRLSELALRPTIRHDCRPIRKPDAVCSLLVGLILLLVPPPAVFLTSLSFLGRGCEGFAVAKRTHLRPSRQPSATAHNRDNTQHLSGFEPSKPCHLVALYPCQDYLSAPMRCCGSPIPLFLLDARTNRPTHVTNEPSHTLRCRRH